MFDFKVEWNARLLERSFVDDALILGSANKGIETQVIESGTVLTVDSGTVEDSTEIEVSGGLELNGSYEVGVPKPLFNPRGGALGFEFRSDFETESIGTDTTRTINTNQRLNTGNIELNGNIDLDGSVLFGPTPRPTDGGLLGDGFNNQTELTNTQA